MVMRKKSASLRREQRRKEFWPDDVAWTGEGEKGFFMAPRTLALIVALLDSKKLSGNLDPGKVYLELWARHIDNGVIELTSEAEHAYAAGYSGTRAVRTWRERMKILEKNGFIKIQSIGNQLYKYVLLIHPTIAIQRLRTRGKVPDEWWKTYRDRQIDTKESLYEDREKKGTEKVVPMVSAKTG
jgi:hypothetical protein